MPALEFRLKSRRGAVVVLLAIMIVSLMAITAIAVDFSRLFALRNELQTSADAAAHAGAIQLSPPNNAGLTDPVVRAYAASNLAMQGPVIVDSLELGEWDDAAKTFTPGASVTNAVNVVVARQATGLMMAFLGVPAPRMRARAIGWADAPVVGAGCMRPWALPYVTLMATLYRKRYCPGNPTCSIPLDSLIRAWDNSDDINTLNSMTTAERTFSLKVGSGNGGVDSVTSGYMPGNFQAVQLPKLWDATTQSYPNPGPVSGAAAYRDNVSGAGCPTLSIGDSLQVQTGNMTEPTIQGALGQNPSQGPGFCDQIVSGNPSSSTYGDCLDTNGNVGVVVKAPFYVCTTGCNGAGAVGVTLLGSFTIMKIYPGGDPGPSPAFDKSQIVGIFNPITASGPIGGGGTTLVRPILVK